MKKITSRQNPLVARFRAAARTNRSNRSQILLDGTKLVEDALAAGVSIDVAVVSSAELRKNNRKFTSLAHNLEANGVTVAAATNEVLSSMSPVSSPSGFVAIAAHRPVRLQDVYRRRGLTLAPVGVQDPGNVGAIIRAADAAGASGVVVSSGSADPFGWRALRGAMGSSFRLPVADINHISAAVDAAHERGIDVIAAVPRGGRSLYAFDLTEPKLIFLGSEGAGLDDEILALADARLTVPMRQHVQSLNAAVAASLIVYEARRQRTRRP